MKNLTSPVKTIFERFADECSEWNRGGWSRLGRIHNGTYTTAWSLSILFGSHLQTSAWKKPLSAIDLSDTLDGLREKSRFISMTIIDAVMASDVAFSGEVSREDLLSVVIDGIQHPECAAYYAEICMVMARQHNQEIMEKKALQPNRWYSDTKNLMKKGADFVSDRFEPNPLTIEEIHAIPYLTGFLPEGYKAKGLVYDQHLNSVSTKLHAAGWVSEALFLRDRVMMFPSKMQERSLKKEFDSSLGL